MSLNKLVEKMLYFMSICEQMRALWNGSEADSLSAKHAPERSAVTQASSTGAPILGRRAKNWRRSPLLIAGAQLPRAFISRLRAL